MTAVRNWFTSRTKREQHLILLECADRIALDQIRDVGADFDVVL